MAYAVFQLEMKSTYRAKGYLNYTIWTLYSGFNSPTRNASATTKYYMCRNQNICFTSDISHTRIKDGLQYFYHYEGGSMTNSSYTMYGWLSLNTNIHQACHRIQYQTYHHIQYHTCHRIQKTTKVTKATNNCLIDICCLWIFGRWGSDG